jgi:predicted transglutaminase-like cysteine proteinase
VTLKAGTFGRPQDDRQIKARVMRRFGMAALAAAALSVLALVPATSAQAEGNFLRIINRVEAPEGFSGLCDQYSWLCVAEARASVAEQDWLGLAKKVNAEVNRNVREITDARQYGREELWALPTRRGGDCEDFALLKKRELMALGISANRLLIATVLDRRREPHAVLILRTGAGDLVLDNLRNKISIWSDTGYSFLRMQDPDNPQNWKAVLAGGVFAQANL